MVDREKHIISLDDAHQLFSVFGIGPDSKAYQRWRREDGFRWVDLEDVLIESPSILVMDWRECLQDAVDIILDQVGELGISADADLGEEGVQGYIEIDGEREVIKYVPNEGDDFDQVIRVVNRAISGKGQYRKLCSCEGNDTWVYGVLSQEDWGELEANAKELVDLLFVSRFG